MRYREYPGRYLTANKRRGQPSHVMVLDTETFIAPKGLSEYHTFRLGWSRYFRLTSTGKVEKDRYVFHDDPLELCRYIEGLTFDRSTLHLYGHNLFFDLQVSLFNQYFPEAGWRLSFIYDEGLTYILIIKRGSSTIKALSTTNYFDCSLDALASDVGVPKIEVDFRTADTDLLSRHCRRDVEIASTALLKYLAFNREHDMGDYRLTRASQSMGGFRHRFMSHKIHIHRELKAASLEREGYFGGRVEAFHFGPCTGGPFLFADVNSMYPSVMRKQSYPIKLVAYELNPSVESLAHHLRSLCAVAECEIVTEEPVYPFHYDKKVLFPIGRFTTILLTPSLLYALSHGHIRSIARAAFYLKAPIFADYVDYWYPLKARYKQEGNAIYRRMVKLYLNSLYGKFGQQRYQEERTEMEIQPEATRMPCYNIDTGERWIEYSLFNVFVRQYGKVDTAMTMTAIAAHVTDYARMRLWELICRVGRERVLYCDTDSIAIRASDLPLIAPLLDPLRLGALSIEKRTDTLTINGCKDYITDKGRTVKGVPAKARLIGPDVYEYDQFARSHTLQAEEDVTGVNVSKVIKRVSPSYDKGEILADGRIKPWVLDC